MLNFREGSSTVLIHWMQSQYAEMSANYYIEAHPEVYNVVYNSSASVQLEVLYNTQYNINITAITCGQGSDSVMVTLHYGESLT